MLLYVKHSRILLMFLKSFTDPKDNIYCSSVIDLPFFVVTLHHLRESFLVLAERTLQLFVHMFFLEFTQLLEHKTDLVNNHNNNTADTVN